MLAAMRFHNPTFGRRARLPGVLACMLIAGACAGATDTDSMDTKNTQQAVAEFLPQVEAALGALAVDRESFEVRANRCEGRQGETRDDLYYIWVGLRGTARGNDIADQIGQAHARWQAAGWEITRFRTLDNGGVNLTATEPATGNTYTLDSGFQPAPDAYVVGFFSTPCFRSPEGRVDFGTLPQNNG